MIDNPSDIIIIDDTIFPLFITEEEEKFDKIRLLLDYLACMNRKCVIKTSQKIWGGFKKQVSENSETYKYLSVLITESKINCCISKGTLIFYFIKDKSCFVPNRFLST